MKRRPPENSRKGSKKESRSEPEVMINEQNNSYSGANELRKCEIHLNYRLISSNMLSPFERFIKNVPNV